jgi:hypothetical protein
VADHGRLTEDYQRFFSAVSESKQQTRPHCETSAANAMSTDFDAADVMHHMQQFADSKSSHAGAEPGAGAFALDVARLHELVKQMNEGKVAEVRSSDANSSANSSESVIDSGQIPGAASQTGFDAEVYAALFTEAYDSHLREELNDGKQDTDKLVEVDHNVVKNLVQSIQEERGQPGAASTLFRQFGMAMPTSDPEPEA